MTQEARTASQSTPQTLPELRPVTALTGVGPAFAEKLARLGILTVQDVLFLLPLRYEDRTRVLPIGALRAGDRAVVEGEVQLSEIVFRGRRQLVCRIADGSGFLTLRFFHFSGTQQAGLARGIRIRCFGEARRGPLGLEIVHPEYRRIDTAAGNPVEDALTPVYPATEGVAQARLRRLTTLALGELRNEGICDWLPAELLRGLELPSLTAALEYVHRPPPDASVELLAVGRHPAQRRLAFEELLAQHLSLRLLRRNIQSDPGWPMPAKNGLLQMLLRALPFALTAAQSRVWHEIAHDLAKDMPMLRLVQGDVGCGKTVVAALAAIHAVDAGFQVVLMAPTELLAEQHARNFANWLDPLAVPLALLTGRQGVRRRAEALAGLASGHIRVAIGTHALFQEHVSFARLGLVIIDEQHRFGVHQRLLLREKGQSGGRYPHQLIMTATPIPRTLAMTAYADLDVSVIDELPPGRTPVRTVVLPEARRADVVQRIRDACQGRRQAYWVCPLIEESDLLEAQAAERTAETLALALPDLKIGLVHGRLTGQQKDAVMSSFKAGAIDLLVATTVIEVGVDVSNASLMVIENAERMGLAQLHQLRGRVGRGSQESTCVLLYKPPLTEIARDRLGVMRDTNDGFEIARRDLELRGPGELLGTRQTGLARMRVADLLRDADLLPRVQQAATAMLESHGLAIAPLLSRWIGSGERFSRV
jgi:ATP-dependent DNA helicase RecG